LATKNVALKRDGRSRQPSRDGGRLWKLSLQPAKRGPDVKNAMAQPMGEVIGPR
jgi:hypothetical protein